MTLGQTWDYNNNRLTLSANVGGDGDFANTYAYNSLGQMTSVQQTGDYGGNPITSKLVDFTYLCPCQLAGADFFRAAVLFGPGTEKRVGGAGGGASSPCSPARGGRNRRTLPTTAADAWQDASATGAEVGTLCGRWHDTLGVRFLLAA